jgi:hypothetical protein
LEMGKLLGGKGGLSMLILGEGEDFCLRFVHIDALVGALSLDGIEDEREVFVGEEGAGIVKVGLEGGFGAAAVVTQGVVGPGVDARCASLALRGFRKRCITRQARAGESGSPCGKPSSCKKKSRVPSGVRK